jgi:hypothetical protein
MPAALNEWPNGPSAAADFCNKICQKRPIRKGRLAEIKGQDSFEAIVFGSL